MAFKIAITHANSLLAEALLEQLPGIGIHSDHLVLLDDAQQSGNRIGFADTYIEVRDHSEFDFEGLSAILLLHKDEELSDLLRHADCPVFSHAEGFAGEWLTPQALENNDFAKPGSWRLPQADIANLLLLLPTVEEVFGIRKVHWVRMLSAASEDRLGVETLARQTIGLLNSQTVPATVFPERLAFNPIVLTDEPAACAVLPEFVGFELSASRQTVQLPAFYGLWLAVEIECTRSNDLEMLEKRFTQLDQVELSDAPVSALALDQSKLNLVVSGIQKPYTQTDSLNFWIISDSVRNGLLHYYIKTIEVLLKSFL